MDVTTSLVIFGSVGVVFVVTVVAGVDMMGFEFTVLLTLFSSLGNDL